jgi:hypothetical protein
VRASSDWRGKNHPALIRAAVSSSTLISKRYTTGM